jgi:hypothetical protein
MKKFFSAVLILAVFLTSTVAMAAFKEEITEGADIASIKRLAVAMPMHYKVEDAEPTTEEFTTIIFDASKAARCYVISYDEIAANIMRDTGVDIKSLQYADARKAYDANISKYADAFVVVTTANNSKKIQFFFEVYDAKNSDEVVYYLTSQSGSIGKNSKDYRKACEDFYKKFDAAAEKNLKEQQKKNK